MRIVDIAADGSVLVDDNGKRVYTGQDLFDYGFDNITRDEVASCPALNEMLVTLYAKAALSAVLDDTDSSVTTMKLQHSMLTTLDKLLSEEDLTEVSRLYTLNLENNEHFVSGAPLSEVYYC